MPGFVPGIFLFKKTATTYKDTEHPPPRTCCTCAAAGSVNRPVNASAAAPLMPSRSADSELVVVFSRHIGVSCVMMLKAHRRYSRDV